MVDLIGLVPTTLGGVIALVINVAIISVVLLLTEKFLAHEMTLKNTLIMAVVAYLIVPIVLAFSGLSFAFIGYILPLIVWIILGEVLLKGDRTTRLKAAAVAFVVYTILGIVGVTSMIAGLL